MAATERSTVIGVFSSEGIARQAVHDLQQAGFDSNQIYYADPYGSAKKDFWQGFKHFFSGRRGSVSEQNVANELDELGLPRNEVQYYEQEFKDGNYIVAVHAPGREQEAFSILRSDGAYNYDVEIH